MSDVVNEQVWCVAWDGDPRMDGSHERIHTGEYRSYEEAVAAYRVVTHRSGNSAKANVRIETRFVTAWKPDYAPSIRGGEVT